MIKIASTLLIAATVAGLAVASLPGGKSLRGKAASAGDIEQSQGTVLQKPVFQCGSGADTQTADSAPGSVAVFESGPVRPIALSADGQRLYVVNAPAYCLEIYSVTAGALRLASTVAVGLEPVAVAERNGREVWVVNHLSDSVSVVRLDGTPRVLRTLQVGDEPRDIVFAGPNRDRAFITTAARGQSRPGASAAQLTQSGFGRADVWVFAADALDDTANVQPLTIVTLFADTPRALAVSPDGNTVYAAAFMSGNGTTTLHRNAVIGHKPPPYLSADGITAPDTGLIVRFDGSAWRDETGADWSAHVKFSLPDYDVFTISASAAMPVVTGQASGVGTTLFNMAVSPADGHVYVSNTNAINHVRFEGPGSGGSTVRGRIAESRISVIDPANGHVDPVHLNSHVDFSLAQGQAVAPGVKAKSLAQPTAMVFSPGGDTLYVAAFGSAKVAVLPTATIATGAFIPNASRHIGVPDGPSGLALDAAGQRLYVYSRIAHKISVIDTASRSVVASVPLFSPEARVVKNGRRFLYDANMTSANGTSSCASCHIFADMDQLAWDLGNPDDPTKLNTNAYIPVSPKTTPRFHPLKGPMTTQTLRGLVGNGPTHWRGDRIGASRQIVNGTLESLESASFKEFNPAFVGLVGRETELSAADMQAFTDFVMTLKMPPNPVRALDNSLSPDAEVGRNIYYTESHITGLGSCNNCHALDPATGRFGTGGLMTFEGFRITENFKVPQLRNVYTKAGMFGFSAGPGPNTGPQIRGFGFSNDGSIDTLDTFFSDPVFNFPPPVATTRAQVGEFVMTIDSDYAPVVGQQVTWRPGAGADVEARLALLKRQAMVVAPHIVCDLVVRAAIDGKSYSGLMQTDGVWQMRTGPALSDAALRALATVAQPLTFTCAPPGTGARVARNGGIVTGSTVVEFYNAALDNYFITADPVEAAAVDAGAAGPGWTRTGGTFAAGGNIAVCRFYGSQHPGPNSHFYTANGDECDGLVDLAAVTPATQKRWNLESLDFFTSLATGGGCASGLTPVYRAYNNGAARGVDSNHRITKSLAGIAEVVARGWISEGVVMCAP